MIHPSHTRDLDSSQYLFLKHPNFQQHYFDPLHYPHSQFLHPRDSSGVSTTLFLYKTTRMITRRLVSRHLNSYHYHTFPAPPIFRSCFFFRNVLRTISCLLFCYLIIVHSVSFVFSLYIGNRLPIISRLI